MGTGMQRSYVNAGGLFFYSAQASASFVDDTLSSQLVMQLNASIKHDKFSERSQWLGAYSGVMGALGYLPLYSESQSMTTEGSASVWDLIIDKLRTRVSSALMEQAQRTLESLRTENDAFALLRTYSVKDLEAANGQAMHGSLGDRAQGVAEPVVQKANESLCSIALQLVFVDKEPLLTQVFISFQTLRPAIDVPLLQLITQEQVAGLFELSIVTSQLDEHHYERYREGLVKKLGSRRAELIIRLGEERH